MVTASFGSTSGLEEADSVMGPTRSGGAESVVDAGGIGQTQQDIDLISVGPLNGGRFAGSLGWPAVIEQRYTLWGPPLADFLHRPNVVSC